MEQHQSLQCLLVLSHEAESRGSLCSLQVYVPSKAHTRHVVFIQMLGLSFVAGSVESPV